MFNIAVLGAGAIGCRIAGHLAQQGVSCTLIDGWQAHVDALNQHGLVMERHGQRQTFSATAFSYARPPEERFNLVLLAVRSDDTPRVLPLAQKLLTDDGCVVSCQNGLNEELVAQAVGAHRTLGCSLILGAKLVAPGHVLVLEGPDTLKVGEYSGGITPRAQAVTALFAACGTSTATANLIGYRWMKLVLNATGNSLLLLSGLDCKGLHEREDARRLIIRMAQEILQTAVDEGASPEPVLDQPTGEWLSAGALDSPALHQALLTHGRNLGARRLSMVADFEARGKTEVDEINGLVVAKAKLLGRDAPLNAAVVRKVHEMENGQRQASADVVAEIANS